MTIHNEYMKELTSKPNRIYENLATLEQTHPEKFDDFNMDNIVDCFHIPWDTGEYYPHRHLKPDAGYESQIEQHLSFMLNNKRETMFFENALYKYLEYRTKHVTIKINLRKDVLRSHSKGEHDKLVKT